MLVGERMSHPVITVKTDTPMQDALKLMKSEHIRRLPVVDSKGHLVGIVSEGDLLHASPSDVTSLSLFELHYLLSKITTRDIMTKPVITVDEKTPIEEAARIMVDSKIGGLPVLRDGNMVGIISETDLFRIFLELMGARDPGVRLSILVPNKRGELAKITQSIFESGGNIVALGTFLGESTENREITCKVTGIDPEILRDAVEKHAERIMDLRKI